MKQQHARIVISLFMAVGLPLGLSATAFAANNGDVSQVENFIRSLINQGHSNKTARSIQIYKNDQLNEKAFKNLVSAVANNNRAGGWRKLK